MSDQQFKQVIKKAYVVCITQANENYRLYAPYNSYNGARLTKRVKQRCLEAVKQRCDKLAISFTNRSEWKTTDVEINWKPDDEYSSYKEDGASGSIKTSNMFVCKINEDY